jgi:hypothetical protein
VAEFIHSSLVKSKREQVLQDKVDILINKFNEKFLANDHMDNEGYCIIDNFSKRDIPDFTEVEFNMAKEQARRQGWRLERTDKFGGRFGDIYYYMYKI